MNEIYEERRLALKAMVEQMGRGAIVEIAQKLDVDQSYVSRCLYPPSKAGCKKIGDAMVTKLDAHYPGWMQTERGYSSPMRSDYEQRIIGYLNRLSETRRQVIEQNIVALIALEEQERSSAIFKQQKSAGQA